MFFDLVRFIIQLVIHFIIGLLFGLVAVKLFVMTGLSLATGLGLAVYLLMSFVAVIAAGVFSQKIEGVVRDISCAIVDTATVVIGGVAIILAVSAWTVFTVISDAVQMTISAVQMAISPVKYLINEVLTRLKKPSQLVA